jgi:TRAP-type uncharacterized transport system fused permease subunit
LSTRRAGHRLLHHLRGDRGSRHDQAWRTGRRRAHVHLLLFSAVGGLTAHRALSVRSSGITGGDPYKTTLQAWKYTLPAFLVPFVFVLDPQGVGLLLKVPAGGSWVDIVTITAKATVGLGLLAMAAQGWALRRTTMVERLLLMVGGLFLVFPSLLEALIELIIGRDISYTATIGVVIGAIVLLKQRMQPALPNAPA